MKTCNHTHHVGTCPACQQHKAAVLKAQTTFAAELAAARRAAQRLTLPFWARV